MGELFHGKENVISAQHLRAGEECIIVGFGQSMTPILKSGQPVRVMPVTADTPLERGDIVFAKVGGHFYLHKIHAVKNGKTFLIGNNHGHMNGWTSRGNIFGRVVEIL